MVAKRGKHLEPPTEGVPNGLIDLTLRCFEHEPALRPSFEDVITSLQDIKHKDFDGDAGTEGSMNTYRNNHSTGSHYDLSPTENRKGSQSKLQSDKLYQSTPLKSDSPYQTPPDSNSNNYQSPPDLQTQQPHGTGASYGYSAFVINDS